MKKTRELLKPVMVLGYLAASYLFVTAVKRKSSRFNRGSRKKLLEWEIAFRHGSSKEERASALLRVDKYILDYVSAESYFDYSSLSITIVHTIVWQLPETVGVKVFFDTKDEVKTGGSPALKPVGPRPHIPPFDLQGFGVVAGLRQM